MIVGGGEHGHAIVFGVLSLLLQIFMPYPRYVRVLRWLTLSLLAYVAVFGTTISPYLFFWQASQEVEEMRADPRGAVLVKSPQLARRHLLRIKIDTYIGMGFSNLIAFFIILSTVVTLHVAGITGIETSAPATEALRPLAGT